MGNLSSSTSLAPNRGVAPGCNWATTMVKVYCLEPFDSFTKIHPKIDLDVHIDDIQMAMANVKSREALAAQLSDAADTMVEVVHVHIKADMAQQKAAVVASDAKLSPMLRRHRHQELCRPSVGHRLRSWPHQAIDEIQCTGKPICKSRC